MPGRYRLDGRLNSGCEGLPVPTGNLRMLASSRGGASGDGDNTWRGPVGPANYDEGNTCTHVSIPGVGSIGSYAMV